MTRIDDEMSRPDDDGTLDGRLASLSTWRPAGAMADAWGAVSTDLRRRRRRRRMAIGAVSVVCVVGALGVAAQRGDQRTVDVIDPASPIYGDPIGDVADVGMFDDPGSHDLGSVPLSGRDFTVLVWTGSRLVMWGGVESDGPYTPQRSLTDGAVFDAATGEWHRMAESPFSPSLYRPRAAWDGSEVIVAGIECEADAPSAYGLPDCPTGPAAAAWNPDTNEWRRLPPPPLDAESLGPSEVGVNGDGVALLGMSLLWNRDAGAWSKVEFPLGPDQVERAVGTCVDVEAGRMIAVTPSGPGPGVTTWVRWLDPAIGTWSDVIDVSSQDIGSGNLGCGRDHIAAERDDGGLPPGAAATPVPEVSGLFEWGRLITMDLDTGTMFDENVGLSQGRLRFLGPWVARDIVDQQWLVDAEQRRAAGELTVEELMSAPTQTSVRRIDQADWTAVSDDPIAEAVWVPSRAGGIWTGDFWIGTTRDTSFPDRPGRPVLSVWVPPTP